jgi:hypothetical protein
MSRSDFWSIAATLIVAGVAYFVGGQKTAYGCIGLGVLIALYLLSTHKRSEPTPVSSTANAQATASPQITANPQLTASPKMSTHIHLPGSQRREKPSQSPPKPKPQHNLQLHSCKMLQIEDSIGPHGEMGGFHSTDDQSKPNTAVVCIKNKSKEGEVADLHDVRAALIFRDGNGKEIGNGIPRAVWVNNQLGNASFDLEETKCVIVAIMQQDAKGEVVGATAPYIRELPTNYGLSLIVEAYELDENLSTVELFLLSKNSRVMEPMMFEFFDENNKPGIRLVSDDE